MTNDRHLGKSTLQNELVGDIGNEFGNLPDGPEDLSLEELGKVLGITFGGDLGKTTSSLIARLMSTKMPAGFNLAAAKTHLETRWGLGPERQKAVMLVALVSQPASRLTSAEEAKGFFDAAANEHASQAGINLIATVAGGDRGGQGGNTMIDSAALEEFTSDQRKLSIRQLELLAAHLKLDLRAPERALLDSQSAQEARQAQLDLWSIEHGDAYANGIVPTFNSLKSRTYDSFWNWVRDDILGLYYGSVRSKITISEREVEIRKRRIVNRASPRTLMFLQILLSRSILESEQGYETANSIALDLLDACKQGLTSKPTFRGSFVPLAPQTTIDARGVVQYCEIPRVAELTLKQYCQEMSRRILDFEQSCRYDVATLRQQYEKAGNVDGKFDVSVRNAIARMTPNNFGLITPPDDDAVVVVDTGTPGGTPGTPKPKSLPFLHLKQQRGDRWEYSGENTRNYMDCLNTAARSGITFHGRIVLVTGSGAGSIGGMVLEGLLEGGSTVIATTSSFSQKVTEYYREIYSTHGARGSRLIILPFNQSSKQDVESLAEYIYSAEKGLGLDLDHILPFAAISEGDNEIDSIDSKSELAHRMMLTNLIRLLGNIKKQKARRGYVSRPTQVILPLSPNHGTFGGDGLYSESKIALETLFKKWGSESWSSFLTLCGANIGWTRGTGLMNANNIIAEGIEKLGVRTFSQSEMAFNILALMTPSITQLCETETVMADLTGSLNSLTDLKSVTTELRKDIVETSENRKLLVREQARETVVINGEKTVSGDSSARVEPRANLDFQLAPLPDFRTEIAPLVDTLKETVNLDKVVVVTGFSELGPLGNSRTRWDMEANGKFSLEGCIEMAWIMGLIKHHTGPIKGREGQYSGWIDCKTGQPLSDSEVKSNFEKQIIEHSGIRLVEPRLLGGRDNRLLQEVVVQEDLAPFEASKEQALNFQKQHGDKAEIIPFAGGNEFQVVIKAGAIVMVPRAVPYEHLVAAQVPSGWDARRYGIPEDIITQVDKATLYVLVCTAEALLSAGIADPYEFYEYTHVSEVANCIGSGLGGSNALRAIYKDRTLDKSAQNDILQETFINTISAWVNMLLLSSSGPIKTPVGACATALESVNIGYDTIITGQARICFVGGVDSFQEEIAAEFGNMKATSDPRAEAARGRSPKEMSRPNTSTRSGFLESEGCGIQILTTAKLALEMGLPIYGIVALATTATDKIGRSVPAPGQGILVNAREDPASVPSPLRASLATWGLTIDDLGVASLHGTSTVANDKNESDILCKQLRHLGRQEGNPLLAITQKSLTGHPKGAAGAWMLNGALQVLNTGLVPGNRNLDNVDEKFEKFDLMHYPGKSIQTDGVKAFTTTSFGFGQKSAQVIGVHSNYLFAALDEVTYEEYKAKAHARQQRAYRQWHSRMISNSIFQAKEKPPYTPEHETRTLLSPNARATVRGNEPSYSITPKSTMPFNTAELPSQEEQFKSALDKLVQASKSSNLRTGVDIEDIASISTSEIFVARNFTEEETRYCRAAGNPQASFAGRWSAKEAVFKSLGVAGKGAGASMREIEIVNDAHGAPIVKVSFSCGVLATMQSLATMQYADFDCSFMVMQTHEQRQQG